MQNVDDPVPAPTAAVPLRATLRMIKFSHTLFALPFALLSAVLAARGIPRSGTLVWILLAMVGARSAAMAFNRIVDRDVDALNPRTAGREIPSGVISVRWASVFCLLSGALFVFSASRLNRLCLVLAPVTLALVLGYSLTKRFTALSHLVLGLSLAIAPVGAWLAVRGTFAWLPILLGLAVLFWVAGFDILYSCQDHEFDCRNGLYSVPRFFGIRNALWIARGLHLAMIALLVVLALLFHLGIIAGVGIAIVALLLAYEHSLVSAHDLSNLNAAFFTTNGVVSVVFFLFVAADLLLRR